MSTSDQHEWSADGERSQQLGAWKNTFPAEGSRSSVTQRPLPLAPQSVEQRLVELLATIGHEFGTPLTVIHGYTTALLHRRQQLSSQELEEFLQFIQQAGLYLEYLLARFFEIAELEAGSVPLQWSLIDIPTLVRESIAVAQRRVPDSLRDRFTFHVQCRDECGNPTEHVPAVTGDERCVRRIMANLLENAVRYSPTGGEST